MYERMLDKQTEPSFNDLIVYSGESGILWRYLHDWIKNEYKAQAQIRFPYGKNYGWAIKYSKSSKHICDIFAESDAFTIFMKINNKSYNSVQSNLSDYAKRVYEIKYPCGDGGWIQYRIKTEEHLNDAKILINVKIKQ